MSDDVAVREVDHETLRTAELHPGKALGDAENFMSGRVVVVKVVDAVDPGATPAIRPEQRLEGTFGLAA